jgi:tripartite-type tricarboxylate transporter receptor subunit TctC
MKRLLARIILCFTMAAGFAVSIPAFSQAYPAKSIRLVVPFAPGGAIDLVARLVAEKIRGPLGQPVVIENRAGANGIVGSEMVARSAPDGYTILLGNSATHISNAFLVKNLSYDPVKDFTPITAATDPIAAFVVNPSVPANSVRELVEYARRNPDKLAYASNGVGSAPHLNTELLIALTGVQMLHVPYKGGGPQTLPALIAGEVQVGFLPLGAVEAYIRSGKVRLLAIKKRGARYSGMPDIPTLTEALPGYADLGTWNGFFGPAGLPHPIVGRLNAEMVKGLNAADVQATANKAGLTVIANTPEQFLALIKEDLEVFGKAIRAAGLKPE